MDTVVPIDFHLYYTQTHSCMYCHQPLRHEVHGYNHYRKYHSHCEVVYEVPVKKKEEKPKYYVWFKDQWIQVNMWTVMEAMINKRAYAITKPKNMEQGN